VACELLPNQHFSIKLFVFAGLWKATKTPPFGKT